MNLTELKKAISKSLGHRIDYVEFGVREADNDRGETFDVREWSDPPDRDPELLYLEPVTTKLLKEMANRPNGLLADLYVHDQNGLYTNVDLVMAYGGEVLAVYDSVTDQGMRYNEFWSDSNVVGTETDEHYKDRILEVMPKGHTFTAEDLGNSYGQAVDYIGLKYGLIRQ